jgi:hypothetical protein
MKKTLIPVLFLCFLLTSCSSNDTVPTDNNNTEATNINAETSEPIIDGTAAPEERPSGAIDPIEEANAIVKDINQNIASYTKVESEKTIKDVNVCDITTYVSANETQKKIAIVCFNGITITRRAEIYYLDEQPLLLELSIKTTNVSPANMAEHDESKTITKKYNFYLKDGSLDEYHKILDENGEIIPVLDEYRQEDISILQATFK